MRALVDGSATAASWSGASAAVGGRAATGVRRPLSEGDARYDEGTSKTNIALSPQMQRSAVTPGQPAVGKTTSTSLPAPASPRQRAPWRARGHVGFVTVARVDGVGSGEAPRRLGDEVRIGRNIPDLSLVSPPFRESPSPDRPRRRQAHDADTHGALRAESPGSRETPG